MRPQTVIANKQRRHDEILLRRLEPPQVRKINLTAFWLIRIDAVRDGVFPKRTLARQPILRLAAA
jgi:hypothetical protein